MYEKQLRALAAHDVVRYAAYACFLLMCLFGSSISSAKQNTSKSVEPATKRAVTVADAISMKRVVDTEYLFGSNGAVTQDFSPDGRYFYIVTRKGNTVSMLNDYELLLYSASDVLDFVNDPERTQLPEGRVLFRLSTSSDHGSMRQHAIRQLRWLQDSRTLLFIGDSGEEPGQVYSVNVESGAQRQLTNHPRPVVQFRYDADSKALYYLSTLENLDTERNNVSYVVGLRDLFRLTSPDREMTHVLKYQYYYLPIDEGLPAHPIGESYYSRPHGREALIWPSPDGGKAISVIPYGERGHRALYDKYIPIQNSIYYDGRIRDFDANTSTPDRDDFMRFVLVDADAGVTEHILKDGPVAGLVTGRGFLDVLWLPDGENVVFGPTFLPRNGASATEWERRRRRPAIVNYNIRTRKITRIADMELPDVEKKLQYHRSLLVLEDIGMTTDGRLTIRYQRRADRTKVVETYEKKNNKWVAAKRDATPETADRRGDRLALSLEQDLRNPPEVLAVDTMTGAKKLITELNPQFRSLTFGEAKMFEWSDSEGRAWLGGLVYPPGYKPGKRYPLVIQPASTRNETVFLMDGGIPTALFSAQAMANKGMMVLHMPWPALIAGSEVIGKPVEVEINRQGVESAIDALDREGVIDRNRVGVIGFSRGGIYADNLITFSDYDFAAVIISDASTLGFFNVILGYGLEPPGMRFIERLIGGVNPWGDDLPTWTCRLTTFNLDRVKTPIRFENYLDNRNYALIYWDQYTLLRRLQKPVEMVLYPRANHTTISPSVRMASGGGAVDWFAFWLNGEEDPDPAKAEQYERWRIMREQQGKSVEAANVARERAKDRKSCELGAVSNP